jgi:hypothetical protein
MDAAERIIAHALPSSIDVDVFGEDGTLVARGRDLRGKEETPMGSLRIIGRAVERQQIWPDASDLGATVILPGGEVGILTAWWNAEDHSEWRWSVELYNHA